MEDISLIIFIGITVFFATLISSTITKKCFGSKSWPVKIVLNFVIFLVIYLVAFGIYYLLKY
ncbi:hypothetical protein BU047_08245 [Staphylococcus simulans]|nr:hypothetical protein BU047_08245 [Staphylococcus simulans]PTJ15472.1 hypothetical protein BU037_11210 [Staphylococcus simulans]PTJ49030.1 hypothetical protein BU014_01835 [Staphylococcus simulans]